MPGEMIAPTVKIDGTDLDQAWVDSLVDIRIELGFRVVGRATLRFADPDYEKSSSQTAKLGKAVEVHARDQGLLMSGTITGVSVEHQVGEQPELVVVVHDEAFRLARSTKVETFTDMTYSDIVGKVCRDNGIKSHADSTSGTVPHLMRVGSALALLDEIADRTGYDWWIDDKTVQFAKPNAGATVDLTLGEELLSFSVRASGLHPTAVDVTGWDRKQSSPIVSKASSSTSVMSPSSRFTDGYDKAEVLPGTAAVLAADFSAMTDAEATEVSEAVLDDAVAAAVTARGRAYGNARIKPGVSVKISDAGPTSGTYHVTQVEHTFRATGFETRFTAGERRPKSLVDTLAGGTTGASDIVNTSFRHLGLVVGTVTNNNDPDKAGRVKLKYPGVSQDVETDWARIVMLGAAKQRGAAFIPEVGDEVLVGFENNDLRQPVVIGGLYSSKQKIPTVQIESGKVQSRSFTSRLGHVIEFGDGESDDKKHVLLELAGKKSKLRLGQDKVDLEVPAGVPIVLKSGEGSITIGKDGSITIKGKKVVIQGEQDVSIEANSKVDVKGNAGATLESSSQTAVKGSMVQVEGQGITEIKGSLVKIN